MGINLGVLSLPQFLYGGYQFESLWTTKTFSREENKVMTEQICDVLSEPYPKENTNYTTTFIVPMKKDLGPKEQGR